MIANYSRVQLLTEKYETEGASRGDLGSVIEVYGNGDYEVEFADEKGIDFAQIVAREEELQVMNAEAVASQPTNDSTTVVMTHIPLPSDDPWNNNVPSLK